MQTLSDKSIAAFEQRLMELEAELEVVLDSHAEGNPRGHEVSSLTRARLTAELRRVEAALLRISEGRFGTCRRCTLPIQKARVLADPAVRYCTDCTLDGEPDRKTRHA